LSKEKNNHVSGGGMVVQLSGECFNYYDLMRRFPRVGGGAAGSIYKVMHENTPYALKHISYDAVSRQRFLDEVNLSQEMAKVGVGPQIISTCDDEQGNLFIVMEYLDMDLLSFFEQLRIANVSHVLASTPKMATFFEHTLGSMMDALLKTGRACVDLKPQNVMINLSAPLGQQNEHEFSPAMISKVRVIDWDEIYCGRKPTALTDEEAIRAKYVMILILVATTVMYCNFANVPFFRAEIDRLKTDETLRANVDAIIESTPAFKITFAHYLFGATTVIQVIHLIESIVGQRGALDFKDVMTDSPIVANANKSAPAAAALSQQPFQQQNTTTKLNRMFHVVFS